MTSSNTASTAAAWPAWLFSQFRMKVLARFDRRLVIYRFDRHRDCRVAPWPEVIHCPTIEEARSLLHADESRVGMSWAWIEDRFAEGAELWAAMDKASPVAWLWIVRRTRLSNWYRPLCAEDKVIYSVVARPDQRGRGIVPRLTASVVQAEIAAVGDIYLDCVYWNTSARRAFEKAGFAEIGRSTLGKVKPLPVLDTISETS